MKKISYLGNSQKIITSFENKAKEKIMTLLGALQLGLSLQPREFKYVPTIGKGVYEIRVRIERQYRVFYVSHIKDHLYILHAFIKKTQKISIKDMNLGIKRYKELMEKVNRK